MGALSTGTLVKAALAMEGRVGLMRKQLEPKVRSKLQEARAEWLELKSQCSGSGIDRMGLRLRVLLLRGDARFRSEMANLIGRMIAELESMRRTLSRSKLD